MQELAIPGAPLSWMRDQQLALAWTPIRHRAAIHSFFMADGLFGHTALSTPDPILARIKLAWWREQGIESDKLDLQLSTEVNGPLRAMAACVSSLHTSIDAWDLLVEVWPPQMEQIEAYALARGQALAEVFQSTFGGDSISAERQLGRWAAAHFARHTNTAEARENAQRLASSWASDASCKTAPVTARVLARLAGRTDHSRSPDIFTAARGAIIDSIL